MDPNANYAEIVSLVNSHEAGEKIDSDRLVDLLEALSDWLINDGFPPTDYSATVLEQAREIQFSNII